MKLIGLPITNESMSDEFKAIIDSNESRVLVLPSGLNMYEDPHKYNDYMCAPAGLDYLLAAGYQFVMHDQFDNSLNYYRHVVMCPFWYGSDGVRRRPHEVTELLRVFMQGINCKNVGMVVQGSPTLWDHVSPWFLEHGWELINTPSSAELAIKFANKYLTLPTHIVKDPWNERLEDGKANVLGCIGAIYRSHKRPELRDDVVSADKVYAVSVVDYEIEEVDPVIAGTQMFEGSTEFNRKILFVERHLS